MKICEHFRERQGGDSYFTLILRNALVAVLSSGTTVKVIVPSRLRVAFVTDGTITWCCITNNYAVRSDGVILVARYGGMYEEFKGKKPAAETE